MRSSDSDNFKFILCLYSNKLIRNILISSSVPISALIMYFIKPYQTPEKASNLTDENSNTEAVKLFDRPESPRRTFRVLVCLWYTCYVIFETMFLKYAVTYYIYCPQKLLAQQAASLFTVASAVFTAFRGINVFIGLKLKIIYIIGYHYVIIIIAIYNEI